MYYHQPRPYFVADDIQVLEKCSVHYANPSGHVTITTAHLIFLYLEQFQSKDKKIKNSRLKNAIKVVIVVLVIITMYHRIYLGAHSINQVLYGLQLGLWLPFYFQYCLRVPFERHINYVTQTISKITLTEYSMYLAFASLYFCFNFFG